MNNIKWNEYLPILTKQNADKISYSSFWIALIVAFIQYPMLIYVYFVLQWAISVGGLYLVTNGFSNLRLLQLRHIIRYILPVLVLYIMASQTFDMHYQYKQYVILLVGFMLYSLLLWIWKRKTIYDVYKKPVCFVIPLILITAFIWN